MRKPVFWVMYLMFVMVAAGGLMATAQLGPIAKDFKIGDVPVSIMGLALPALTFALAIDRVLNGLTRPFFGWVSDQIGREPTMFIAFALEAVGILALYHFGQNPVAFVILTGLVFFAWGEIYSLFPSTCADTFGSKYAAANAGLLYTAKGTASLLVPLSSVLAAATGSWHAVFIAASVMNALAALMAWFVLRPMRRAHIERAEPDRAGDSAATSRNGDARRSDLAGAGALKACRGTQENRAWPGFFSVASLAGRSDRQRFEQLRLDLDLRRLCCSSGPSIRKVSSTRSPSVVTLASCRLMWCCASTRATE